MSNASDVLDKTRYEATIDPGRIEAQTCRSMERVVAEDDIFVSATGTQKGGDVAYFFPKNVGQVVSMAHVRERCFTHFNSIFVIKCGTMPSFS